MLSYREDVIQFLPPQIFELSRLANFQQLASLMTFLSKREQSSNYHIERMLGICHKMLDATILTMPGDDHHPVDASYTTPILSTNRLSQEFDSQKQYRLVMMHNGDNRKWQLHYKNNIEHRKCNFDVSPLAHGWEN
jgi:hypothetical protein